MDPLSISASIVSLIGAADTVARRLYKYVKAARGAEKDIATLSMEITSLYGVLNSLHLVASRFESEISELSMQERAMRIEHIHACYNTLDKIRSLLTNDDPSATNSKLESVRRRLHWPLSESKTKSLIDEVGKHKQTLALALNADTMTALLEGLSLQKEMSNGIDEIRNRMNLSSISEKRRKVLGSFAQGVDPQRYLSAALKVRQMGTGQWICENTQFKAWMNGSSSRLYITGIPGAGKTILTAIMIEEISKRVRQGPKGSAVAYYFCDYRDPSTQVSRNILASLAGQLAVQDEQCFATAQTLYRDHHPEDSLATAVSEEEYKQCLLEMIRKLDHAYIMVDALDECNSDRATTLETLHNLNDFANDGIKTLFTGREEVDIQRVLGDYDKLSIAASSHDIRLYVDSEIARRTKNGTLKIRDPALQEEIRERLVTKAEGMFRYATCQIDHICALSNDRSRRKALDALPPDLPTTYERVLERVNASDEENQLIVQRTLRWILWATHPLSLAALSEAVSVNIDDRTLDRDAIVDPEAILLWCGSLVRKTPGAGTLELAHYTVKEYLEQLDVKRLPQYTAYKADMTRDSLELARTCLTYLCFDDFDLAQIHDLRKMTAFMENYELLRYCIQSWDVHAQVVEDDKSLLELLQNFLNTERTNHYLVWMTWVASIMAEVVEAGQTDVDEGYVDYGTMALLLSKMADSSPLHWAATLSLPTMCQWLVSKGCSVNQGSDFFGSPLLAAIDGGESVAGGPCSYIEPLPAIKLRRRLQYQTVKFLLEIGADCNTRIRYRPEKRTSNEVETSALRKALSYEDGLDVVRLLLDSGALCDRDSLDILSRKDSGAFKIFQRLTEANIEKSQLSHFRKLATDADLGWDRVFDTTTIKAPQRVLSGIDTLPLFFNAAKFGRLHVMELLAPIVAKGSTGKGINEVNGQGNTALHIACSYSHGEIVKTLIREGIDIDITNASGMTALMFAAQENNVDCATILLRHGANVRVMTNGGVTALQKAALQKSPLMMQAILSASIPEGPSLYHLKDRDTLLHTAAFAGSLPVIEYIMLNFNDASPRDRLPDESTCLHLATSSGSLPAITYFLDCGLSPNDWNNHDKTPVFSAVDNFEHSSEAMKLLHSRGADTNAVSKSGNIPLFNQIRCLGPGGNPNMMDCLNFLLDRTTDINHVDKERNNALHVLAAYVPMRYPNFYLEDVYLALIKRGCSMTMRNKDGHSPFQRFIMNWSELEYDSDGFFQIQCQRPDDSEEATEESPRFAIRPQIGMTLFILKYWELDQSSLGPPEEVDCWGASLLSLAIRTANPSIVKQVLTHDQDVDRRDISPGVGNKLLNTPLEWLCTGFAPGIDLIRVLLSSSKSLEQQRPDGLAPVHIAALNGNVKVLEELLNMGIDPDCLSGELASPLMYACNRQRLEAIQLLYGRGARIAVSESWDSIRGACEKGADNVLSSLHGMPELNLDWRRTFVYELGFLRNVIEDIQNMTYFHYAALHGLCNIVEWLFDAELVHDVNSVVGDSKLTALYLAAGFRDSHHGDMVPLLLSKGADVGLRCTGLQWTALHIAAAVGNLRAAESLLAHGADADATDTGGFTPRLVAQEWNQSQTAQRLLDHTVAQETDNRGIQPNKDKISASENILNIPLHSCAKSGQVQMMRKLLDDGADINARAHDCTTPIMMAARGGHLKALDLLKEGGADFKANDLRGWTALHHACRRSQSLVIPGLLELGLEFIVSDNRDITPLHVCSDDAGLQDIYRAVALPARLTKSQLASLFRMIAMDDRIDMLKWALSLLNDNQKQDALLDDGFDGFALHTAASRGSVKILELLLDAGADIDRWSERRSFPLACAATMGRSDAVQFLAKRGAKLKHQLLDGTESCGIEAAKNYPKIQQWLRDFYHVDST